MQINNKKCQLTLPLLASFGEPLVMAPLDGELKGCQRLMFE